MDNEKTEVINDKTEAVNEKTDAKKTTVEKPIKAKMRKKPTFRTDELIMVKNGYYGTLNIGLKKAGYDIVLHNFGDEAEIEFGELRILRNEHRSFFEKNWLMIDNIDVLEALDVKRFYEKSLDIGGLETLFDLDADEMMTKINNLNDGQKRIVVYMAVSKIETGEIDSRKTIGALEEALGVELIER